MNFKEMGKTQETIKLLARSNKPNYNLVKLSEELFELGEVVMKLNNKSLANQPPIAKLIEELGDVKLRIEILSISLNIKPEVKQRVKKKCTELREYYDQDKYTGGL